MDSVFRQCTLLCLLCLFVVLLWARWGWPDGI